MGYIFATPLIVNYPIDIMKGIRLSLHKGVVRLELMQTDRVLLAAEARLGLNANGRSPTEAFEYVREQLMDWIKAFTQKLQHIDFEKVLAAEKLLAVEEQDV